MEKGTSRMKVETVPWYIPLQRGSAGKKQGGRDGREEEEAGRRREKGAKEGRSIGATREFFERKCVSMAVGGRKGSAALDAATEGLSIDLAERIW
eukprot:2152620-Rhodomonas_salina.3